jgi:hypothetical protein
MGITRRTTSRCSSPWRQPSLGSRQFDDLCSYPLFLPPDWKSAQQVLRAVDTLAVVPQYGLDDTRRQQSHLQDARNLAEVVEEV